jgi:hypothetical protein
MCQNHEVCIGNKLILHRSAHLCIPSLQRGEHVAILLNDEFDIALLWSLLLVHK